MSVENTFPAEDFAGATLGVPLPVNFPVMAITDIYVAKLLVGGTDFINLTPDVDFTRTDLGGNNYEVTTTATYASSITIRVFRITSPTQPYSFPDGGPLPAESISDMGDRLCMIEQETRLLAGIDGLTMTMPPGSQVFLPTVTAANSTERGNLAPVQVGQLLIQTNTGGLYRGNSLAAGGWAIIATGAAGDFFGPGSSIVNRLVTFADTTGKLGEDASGITALAGALAGVSSLTGTAGNMTITSGTGNSRTLAIKTTTSSGVATTALTIDNQQNATFSAQVITGGTLYIGGATPIISFMATSVQIDGSVASTLETNATKFRLGGTNNGFPMLKRNTTGIDFRLADDSGYAPVNSLYQRFGSGTPEGAVTAPVGATFNRTDGGAGTSFYVKETGSGNTGWVGK